MHINLLQLSHHCISVSLLHESHLGPFPLVIACNIDNVRPGLLVGKRNIPRSVTVAIPITGLSSLAIGSLRILFFNIISAASSTVVVGCAVISGCEAKLSSNVSRYVYFKFIITLISYYMTYRVQKFWKKHYSIHTLFCGPMNFKIGELRYFSKLSDVNNSFTLIRKSS